MRAREFISEDEQWDNLPTPAMQRQFDAWDQQKRGRNAITTMPIPRTTTNPGHRAGPNSEFVPNTDVIRDPDVAKELGLPRGWTNNDPNQLTSKMIDPKTGAIRLGPDVTIYPGTEEYAELKMRLDTINRQISPSGAGRLPRASSEPPSSDYYQRSQREVPKNTKDKGVLWPQDTNHPKSQRYRMVDPKRERNRT